MSIIASFTRAYLINTSSHIPKEILFRRYTASPPDKGDLGGFFHEKSFLGDIRQVPLIRGIRGFLP